ncbi:MAG: hypothetical protein WKH64_09895 [Chloroflexia bacterium]
MTRAGLPVPPGFTITTEACREYYRPWPQPPGRALGSDHRRAPGR